MKFKDLPERTRFVLTDDAKANVDIVYIKSYQDDGRYNAVKLGTPVVPVLVNPDFDVTPT